jgi:hypothetical protein
MIIARGTANRSPLARRDLIARLLSVVWLRPESHRTQPYERKAHEPA